MINVDELEYYENLLDILDSPFTEIFDNHNDVLSDSASGSEDNAESELDLLLDFDMKQEKSSGKRKRAHTSDSSVCSDSPKPQKRCKMNPSVIAPSKYSNFLVSALNQHDTQSLRNCFNLICTTDARIALHIYDLRKSSESFRAPLNHFGNFSSADLDQESFIAFQSALSEIVPDGFTEVVDSRSCYEGESSSVYISRFRSSGTIINKDSMIGIADEKGRLLRIRQSNPHVCNLSAMHNYTKPFVSNGSLVMYRNGEGKVTNIELYYEYSL